MIYLDNAATTYPKPEKVYNAMDEANRNMAVNAGRGSYKLAREASELIFNTKDLLRKLVKADHGTPVIFAPSITIALNEIINGIEWHQNEYVYVSPYEHNAVARPIHLVEKRHGIKVKQLPLDARSLEIDLEKVRYEFSVNKPRAVFCTHVSNVTGYVLPIEQIFDEAKKYNAITVLDSAQSLGLVPLDARTAHADIIAFAGHKSLYGPFGIGGFINISVIPLSEVVVGGTGSDSLNLDMPDGKESKYESASSNIVAIVGLNAAISCLNVDEINKSEIELTAYAVERLSGIRGIKVFTPPQRAHIGIISFTLDGFSSEDIGVILDEDFDIAVRTGYHCAPFIHEHLQTIGSLGTVRVGIGLFTTKDEIDALQKALIELKN